MSIVRPLRPQEDSNTDLMVMPQVFEEVLIHQNLTSKDPVDSENVITHSRSEQLVGNGRKRSNVITRKKSHSNCYLCKICLQPFSLIRYLRKHLAFPSAGEPSKCQEYYRKTNPDNIWEANLYIAGPQDKIQWANQEMGKSQGNVNIQKEVSKDSTVEEIWIISDDEADMIKEPDRQQNASTDVNDAQILTANLDQPNPPHIVANVELLMMEDEPNDLIDIRSNGEETFNQNCNQTTYGEKISNSLYNVEHDKLADNISRTCNTCNKTFSRNQSYKQHMLTVHQPSQFQCDICQKKFTEMGTLRKHTLVAHDKFRYECELCPKEFTSLHYLRHHNLVVHNGVRFNCDLCEKKFKSLLGLKRHKLTTHSGTRYKCDLCPKEFTRPQTLKMHKLNVHDGFRFKCDVCQKTYTTSKTFRRHQLAGGGAKCTGPAQKIYSRDK